jgi:hypothetical protein
VRTREAEATAAMKEVVSVTDSAEANSSRAGSPSRISSGWTLFEFVEAWKRGEIEDTAQNAERAIDALALRALLQRASDAALA